jgi:DNA-binding LacI/PurR family transcriptional regulator
VIAGPSNITAARSRLRGVRDVLGPEGMPPELVVDGGFTVPGGERTAGYATRNGSSTS